LFQFDAFGNAHEIGDGTVPPGRRANRPIRTSSIERASCITGERSSAAG
jgi:hypothetical protein